MPEFTAEISLSRSVATYRTRIGQSYGVNPRTDGVQPAAIIRNPLQATCKTLGGEVCECPDGICWQCGQSCGCNTTPNCAQAGGVIVI